MCVNGYPTKSHCLKDQHGETRNVSMDRVKMSYIAMMKMSSTKAPIDLSTCDTIHDKSMQMACEEYPVMESFDEEGWALPVRAFFRYSKCQKKILYDLFIQDEETNKKLTPEQVVGEIRSH